MNKPKHFRFRIISGSLIGNPYSSEFCGVCMFAVPRRAKFRDDSIFRYQGARVVMDVHGIITSLDYVNRTFALEQMSKLSHPRAERFELTLEGDIFVRDFLPFY